MTLNAVCANSTNSLTAKILAVCLYNPTFTKIIKRDDEHSCPIRVEGSPKIPWRETLQSRYNPPGVFITHKTGDQNKILPLYYPKISLKPMSLAVKETTFSSKAGTCMLPVEIDLNWWISDTVWVQLHHICCEEVMKQSYIKTKLQFSATSFH